MPFGKRRFSQETADFHRNPQKAAGTRRKPQIGICPLGFVPLSAALPKPGAQAPNKKAVSTPPFRLRRKERRQEQLQRDEEQGLAYIVCA